MYIVGEEITRSVPERQNIDVYFCWSMECNLRGKHAFSSFAVGKLDYNLQHALKYPFLPGHLQVNLTTVFSYKATAEMYTLANLLSPNLP